MNRRRRLAALLPLLLVGALGAQARTPLVVASDLLKDSTGAVLAHLAAGTPVVRLRVKGNLQEVTVEGWVVATSLRDDARGDGAAVIPAEGTPLRAAAGSGATLGSAHFGMRFVRLETKSGWARVRRSGWVSRAAFTAPAAVVAKPPVVATKAPLTAAPKQGPTTTTPPATSPAPAPATNAATSMLAGGTSLAATPAGSAIGMFEVPVKAEVLERRSGWAHVRIDGWVREGSLGEAPPPGSITAADLRSQPDRYIGQTVEWTLQVIAVQKADDLRPELPTGQPYVLARGPLPEAGFVYMVIAIDQEDTFRSLQPLTKIRVRAIVRAGRSKYLQVPVLTFVRRLD